MVFRNYLPAMRIHWKKLRFRVGRRFVNAWKTPRHWHLDPPSRRARGAAGLRQDGRITGLMQCAALCHAHGVELVPHQTQPTIGHAANIHLIATLVHLAKPVEVADNPRRLNALFKNTPDPRNGAFPLPSGPGLGLLHRPPAAP